MTRWRSYTKSTTGIKAPEGIIYIPHSQRKSTSLSHKLPQPQSSNTAQMAAQRAIPDNWATMALTPTVRMGYGRYPGPGSLNVNFPNRDALPPERRWLWRSIFIYVTGGRKTEYTKYRLGHYFANQLNCEFSSLIIEDVDEIEADYILVCPDDTIKRRILSLGALTLEADVPGSLPTSEW